ncbi:hypothetical protein D3C81_1554640 [compost metagenome]
MASFEDALISPSATLVIFFLPASMPCAEMLGPSLMLKPALLISVSPSVTESNLTSFFVATLYSLLPSALVTSVTVMLSPSTTVVLAAAAALLTESIAS